MTAAQTESPVRRSRACMLLKATATGAAYYALACPLARVDGTGDTLAAIAWPAPACAIALLWPMRRDRWPPYLVAIFIAMMCVGRLDPLPTRIDCAFAVLNVVEVALGAWLGQRYVARDGALTSLRQLARFMLLLPAGAVACLSALGATLAHVAMGSDWWHEWHTFFVGNALAMLILVPALLGSRHRHGHGETTPDAAAARRATLAGTLAVAATLAVASAWPVPGALLRALLALVLVATAIYGGMQATSITVGFAAVLGVGLTLAGFGPYAIGDAHAPQRLQADLGSLAVLSFFIAVAARERQQLAIRLERARRLEALGLLASGVAHDFNNILGAVSGYAEMTDAHLPEDSPALGPLSEVRRAAERGKDLTQQILLATRRGDRTRETLDPYEIAREAVSLARPSMRAGITLELAPPSGPLSVAAHRGQLVRAVLNLLRNASQSARGRVAVRVRGGDASRQPVAVGDAPPGDAAWIEVEDDGTGIAPASLPRLFEPFYTARAGGTGLGLAIVAGVACEHGGGVSVDTDASGTCFRLVLPCATTSMIPGSPT